MIKNENYIMREYYLVDAILMEAYIYQYVDTAIGLENNEEYREISG